MAHEHLGTPSTLPSFVPVVPAPIFLPDDSPTRVIEPARHGADIEPSYVLVRSAAPIAPEECEEAGATAIEVTVLWGTNVLHVLHLSPPRAFTVGHGDGERVDFLVPAELAPFARSEIVSLRSGTPHVVAPQGAELGARTGSLEMTADDGFGGRSAPLRDGAVAEIRFGALSFRIASVAAGKRVPRQVGGDTSGLGASFLATFAAVGAFLGAIAYFTPALGATLDEGLDPDDVRMLRIYLDASAEREQKLLPSDGKAASTEGGGTPGTAAQGQEGKMGRPDKPSVQKKFAVKGDGPVVLSHEQLIAEVRDFGMVGVLNTLNSRSVPQALWGASVPNGPDTVDAWGEMFGESIGESGGAGGLGLLGDGKGAGGYGEQIGIGRIGTCGTNCGMGPGDSGIGNGVGRTTGGRVTKGAPTMRPGATIVSGHLPAEVIQRIVRQNYGRFRQCYETGLRSNPNLTGRVTARFVIGRGGSVTHSANGGGDLPDSTVTSCVIGAFYGLSFPSPDNGIVTVTYPIMFVPG